MENLHKMVTQKEWKEYIIQLVECVVEVDGFYLPKDIHNRPFACKEMSVTYLSKPLTESCCFRVDELHNLHPKTKAVVDYTTRNVHGLSFNNHEEDLPPEECLRLLRNIQNTCEKETFYVAVRETGGATSELLSKAKILHIPLDMIECPTYKELAELYPISNSNACGFHNFFREGRSALCPVIRSTLVALWLLDN